MGENRKNTVKVYQTSTSSAFWLPFHALQSTHVTLRRNFYDELLPYYQVLPYQSQVPSD